MAGARPTTTRKPAAPERPPGMAHGRWLADLGRLSAAERRLLDACARGDPLVMGSDVPDRPTSANRIRGAFVRFLLLGGDPHHPVHEAGVMLKGGWIAGEIDLHQSAGVVRLRLLSCAIPDGISLMAGSIPELSLPGSRLSYLRADRARVAMNIFLNAGFEATGPVRLLGADIGSDLSCTDGTFTAADVPAISADGLKVHGNVFLTEGFTCNGQVRMVGARIDNSLFCDNGDFINPDGIALDLERVSVGRSLMIVRGRFEGRVALTAADAAIFSDGQACYDHVTATVLAGFRYRTLAGPTDVAMRLDWLRRQPDEHLTTAFRSQPWEELIRVLRDMGHTGEAATIAMAKQEALRRAGKIGRRQPNPAFRGWRLWLDRQWNPVANMLARGLHRFYGWVAGYGHRPSRIVSRMLLICAVCSLAFYFGRDAGLMGPADPLIHHSVRLRMCGTGGDPGTLHWTDPRCPVPPEYSTFQPFFYALDVMLPLIDLHQEADWAPVVTNAAGETLWAGRALRWLMWFEILFGWVASLMFVAIVGRLVEKD